MSAEHDWTEPQRDGGSYKSECRRCGMKIQGFGWPGKRTAEMALDAVKEHTGQCEELKPITVTCNLYS